jgi:NADH-quinone oxidoreductase subunit F
MSSSALAICYFEVKPEDVPDIVAHTVKGEVLDRLLYTHPGTGQKAVHLGEVPFYKHQTRLLIGDNPRIDPMRIEDYLALGGYAALSKALFEMSPDQVIDEVKKANLRGRGGGGFPAGLKWETAKNAPGEDKYVIVNAHEGEPGAFMDRALFTGNPHLVLEGLIIGAYAIGAHQGFIYTRHDSPQLIEHIERALAQAEEYGFLGEDVLGSGFNLGVELHFDVGIFVSGESSALMQSIEGNPPEPRSKYIRTSVSGIWDRPSNLNNVETWANVPQIISRGAEWYASIGTERSKGTKLISLSGNIMNGGVAEVPMGTPLRTIVYDIGGGVPGGKAPRAIHLGGPMGGSIPERLIDTPLDFDELATLGAPIGAGGLLVMDGETDMVEVARYLLEFLTNESCGKCVPCREGMRQMLKILTNITKGKGKSGDIGRLEDLSEVTGVACLCALGKTAPDPLRSMLRYFRDEFEAQIASGTEAR